MSPGAVEGLTALEGSAAVVTGASRGLGRAFAIAMSTAGARVVVNGTDRDATDETVELIRSAGGTAVGALGSVADYDFCESLINTCTTEFGRIDHLVNNAGITRDRSVMKMTPADFDEVVGIHLRGTWACSAIAARGMRDGGGTILSITSGSGLFGMFGQANYAAAKAGIVGLNRVLHLELQRYGVRANVLAPVARTRITDVFDRDSRTGVAHESPFPPADSVAPLVVFLASPAAARIAGQVLSFDGTVLSVWSHPEATSTWDREGGWGADDFAGALTDGVLEFPHPDRWGRGVSTT